MAIIAVGRALQFVDFDPDAAHDVYCKHKLVPWVYYQIHIIAAAHAPEMPETFSPPPTPKETVS